MSMSHSQIRLSYLGVHTHSVSGSCSYSATHPLALQQYIVLIEPRRFVRECLANGIEQATGAMVIPFASTQKWLEASYETKADIILLSGLDGPSQSEMRKRALRVSQANKRAALVILTDDAELSDLSSTPDSDVAGFIQTDMSLDLLEQALRLIRKDAALPHSVAERSTRIGNRSPGIEGLLTTRQAQVVEAITQGKPNKTIAYELQLQECTVKVHIRNIMKKLNARNPTEVAYIVSNYENKNIN